MRLTLSGITLGSDQLALTPTFDPQRNEYTVAVPSNVTTILVTFRKAVYDTVWGFSNAGEGRQCTRPDTKLYNIPGGPSATEAGNWTPTASMLHGETYNAEVKFTGSYATATSCRLLVNLYDGTTTKQTKITFNRVSA